MAKIAISAATLSGNQGAAGMLRSTIENLGDKHQFYVFTVYEEADKELNNYHNVEIFKASPKQLVLVLIPLCFLYRILPFARSFLAKFAGLGQLASSDLQIDLAGISFADGRRPFLLYNVASLLPPLFLRLKIVKFAQASGPFKDPLNRQVAKWFLPSFLAIFARGAATKKALDSLKLNNVSSAADIAFLFEPSLNDKKIADDFLKKNKLRKNNYLVFSPSQVLHKKAQKLNIDYATQTAEIINQLIKKTQLPIVLLPHAVRGDLSKLHNNDLPIINQIYQKIDNKKLIFKTDGQLLAGSIKQVIAGSQVVVAARFHAMIASLSSSVPVVVTGWSHKYQEVLDSFGLDVGVVYLDESYIANTLKQTLKTLENRATIAKQIKAQLPIIMSAARTQLDLVQSTVQEKS